MYCMSKQTYLSKNFLPFQLTFKEMLKFHVHWKCAISVTFTEISRCLKCSFSSCLRNAKISSNKLPNVCSLNNPSVATKFVENDWNILKSLDFSLQHFVGFLVCLHIHPQHSSSSLLSTPSIRGWILLVNFWWQGPHMWFLTTNEMFCPLEQSSNCVMGQQWPVLGKVPACGVWIKIEAC